MLPFYKSCNTWETGAVSSCIVLPFRLSLRHLWFIGLGTVESWRGYCSFIHLSHLRTLKVLRIISQNPNFSCQSCVVALPHIKHFFGEHREPVWPRRFWKKIDSYGEGGKQGLADPNKVEIGVNLDWCDERQLTAPGSRGLEGER